jgi:lipoprotein-anchoring transpeptidase ErfK/SrfK
LVAVLFALAGCQTPSTSAASSPTPRSPKASPHVPPPPPASISIVPDDAARGVAPDQPVTVQASGGTLTEVTVTDADGQSVAGRPGDSPAAWVSTAPLLPAMTYTVSAKAINSAGRTTWRTSIFSTLTPTKIVGSKIAPLEDEVVGVGMPIVVYFTAPVTDRAAVERRMSVQASIPIEGAWHWYSSTEVHYRPRTYWPVGDKVTVDVNLAGVNAGNGVWGRTDHVAHFRVGDSHITKVDAKTDKMQVMINGKLAKTLPVSLGREKYPTTSGVHVVLSKTPKIIMDSATVGIPKGNPDYYYETVLWDVRISWSGEFVHSAPWSVSDQGRENVSHGCINASPADAEWFYNLSQRGDVVIVQNTPRKLESGNGWTDWNMSWADWVAGSAVATSTHTAQASEQATT